MCVKYTQCAAKRDIRQIDIIQVHLTQQTKGTELLKKKNLTPLRETDALEQRENKSLAEKTQKRKNRKI